MRRFGTFLIVMAIGSAILPYIGLQFVLVSWIDLWGEMAGWIIRGAMIVLGVVLIAAESRQQAAPTPRPIVDRPPPR